MGLPSASPGGPFHQSAYQAPCQPGGRVENLAILAGCGDLGRGRAKAVASPHGDATGPEAARARAGCTAPATRPPRRAWAETGTRRRGDGRFPPPGVKLLEAGCAPEGQPDPEAGTSRFREIFDTQPGLAATPSTRCRAVPGAEIRWRRRSRPPGPPCPRPLATESAGPAWISSSMLWAARPFPGASGRPARPSRRPWAPSSPRVSPALLLV